jgi:hypothetical protein
MSHAACSDLSIVDRGQAKERVSIAASNLVHNEQNLYQPILMIQHFQTGSCFLHQKSTPVGTLKSPSDRTRVGAILGTIQADWPRQMTLFSMAETRLPVTTVDRQYTLEASMPLTVLSEPKVASAIVLDIRDAVFLIEGKEEPSIPYARQIHGTPPVIAEMVSYTRLTHQPVPGHSLGTC